MPVPADILRLLAAVNGRRREDVSLAALSRLAHRSPHDLHRRFRSAVGETPKAYVARVRLARAAADLLGSGRPVARIAAEHGFASHEVFTRAFGRAFGVPPSRYRALHAAGPQQAATAAAVAPCVGLYRSSTTPSAPTTERGDHVPAEITLRENPAVHAIVVRRRVTREEIPAALGEILPLLFGHAQRAGLAMAGPPFTRYPEVAMGSLVLEGGIPLVSPAEGDLPEGVEALTVPAGPAAVAIHVGPYDRLGDTYADLERWLDAEGRRPSGPPRETYLTDPGDHPDPETWRTEIAQPVR